MASLIVILICLGLQRYLGINISLADFDWFKPYHALLKSSLGKSDLFKGYIGVAVVVLPLVLVVAIVDYLFNDWIFSVLDLAFGVLVLMYCMDARDLKQRLSAYLGGEGGEKADAEKQVSEFLGAGVPSDEAEKARSVTTAIFTQSLHQVFSVLFWYLILGGAAGAMLYFAVTFVQKNDKEFADMSDANAMVLGVLDWVPVRLLGISFALVGSFGNVFSALLKALTAGIERSNEFATEFGLAALDADTSDASKADAQESSNAADLVFRTLIIWVVVIAVLVIVRSIH